jgi:hypothetical protein
MTELGEQELGEQLVEAAQILPRSFSTEEGLPTLPAINRHRKPEEMSRC